MKYVIYEPASRGRVRQRQITNDAREANFLTNYETYEAAINHPIEDKSAVPVINIEAIYYQGIPTQNYNFEIFFTQQEIARAIDNLPSDWYTNEETI